VGGGGERGLALGRREECMREECKRGEGRSLEVGLKVERQPVTECYMTHVT